MPESGKNKVIYVGSFNQGEILSGPEKVSKRIFEEFSKIEETLFVCYFQDGSKYGYTEKLFGRRKITSVNGSDVLMLGIFRMLFEIQKLNPEIIHILCFNRFVIFLYLLKIFSRVRILYTLNGIVRHENNGLYGESVFTDIKNKLAEFIIVNTSDSIFYLSEFSKNVLLSYYSPAKSKFTKAINGLDDCFLGQVGVDYTENVDNSIVFIGNIDKYEKGFCFLIDVLSELRFETKLYIIDSSEKKIRRELFPGISVSIIDKLTPGGMIEFFKDKGVIVSVSKYDTFNISVLEAVSCGLYPVLTNQTGASEILGDYVSISRFNFGDENSLREILENLRNGNLRRLQYKNLSDFSWKSVLEKYYIPVYEF